MKRLIFTVLVLGLVAGAPGGGLAAGGSTLTVDPTTVQLRQTFTIEGCGYPVPTTLTFEVTGPRKADTQIHSFTSADPLPSPDGCFSEQWTAWWGVAGAYQVPSMWRDRKGTSHKAAVVKFTV